MTLAVIGAGWGRTGTLSTKVGLEVLGFGPCYHMHELFQHHPEHQVEWIRAARGEAVDWDALFAGYRAAVDWPTAGLWRELADAFPEAKVLLTARDPEAWYESFCSTISDAIPETRPAEDDLKAMMMHEVITRGSFRGTKTPKDALLDRYRAHVEEVRATIDPDRLLVWSVQEGWAPLCAFLDVPVPDRPFPRVNDRDEFRTIFREGTGAIVDRSAPA
jgi:hypothetical protein